MEIYRPGNPFLNQLKGGIELAGFREYRPGQVWFYYNPWATKDNEKKRELGAVTCRPVVVVQSAFYPEWNDIVTVVPMTHSDRRSGIPIDTTVLKDGGVVEGGTVLPYLIYSVKTKFLFPMMTTGSNRRRLISLAPEDFEKVLVGLKYHLGFSDEVPDYVANWKTIGDYDRKVIVKDIELAISECDAVMKTEDLGRAVAAHRNVPVQRTRRFDQGPVENHILAAMTGFDPTSRRMYDPKRQFNRDPIRNDPDPTPEPKETTNSLPVKIISNIQYDSMSVDNFLEAIGASVPMETPHIYEGSNFLGDRQLKQMPAVLTKNDIRLIMSLSLQRIVECTGIRSTSTVSRLRNIIRQAKLDEGLEVHQNFTQNPDEAPDPFIYTGSGRTMKARNRRNQLRYHVLFQLTEVDKVRVLKTDDLNELSSWLGISTSNCRQIKVDILTLNPELAAEDADTKESTEPQLIASDTGLTVEEPPKTLYEFWETLAPSEINEIRSTTKKKVDAIAKNFGITRPEARQIRGQVTSVVKHAGLQQPTIAADTVEPAISRIIKGDYQKISEEDIMIFCRTDPIDISAVYSKCSSSSIPSKSDIRQLKINFRKAITKPIV